MKPLEIIDYQPIYAEDFKRINYAWIEKYFGVEAPDRKILEEHQSYVLDKGGAILFAKYGDEIVGTCALIKIDQDTYELAKMGVLEGYQGLKIGRKLGEAIIQKAKEKGAKKVVLETNGKLEAALRLYQKLGFREDGCPPASPYDRCDVQLVLEFYESAGKS